MNNVSLGLVHEAEVMLRKFGADRDFWVRIARDETLAQKVVNLVTVTQETYQVVVDYNCRLAQMIQAGNYDSANSDITAEHFPVKGKKERHKVSVVLLHFNREMESDKVIAEMGQPL